MPTPVDSPAIHWWSWPPHWIIIVSTSEVPWSLARTPEPRDTETYFLSLLKRSRRPKTLFHYTSPGGLLGIAQSGQIWATAVEYLNDGLEWVLVDQVMRYRLSELVKEGNNPQRVTCFESILKAHDLFSGSRMYVASFSARGDVLSQRSLQA